MTINTAIEIICKNHQDCINLKEEIFGHIGNDSYRKYLIELAIKLRKNRLKKLHENN